MPRSASGVPKFRGTILLLPAMTEETCWRDKRSMRCDLKTVREILSP